MMAPGAWDRLGGAVAATAIVLGAVITTIGSPDVSGRLLFSLSLADALTGARILSGVMLHVAIGAVLRAQRTWMGRLCGWVALAGAGLHLSLIELWLMFPLLNSRPHVRSVFLVCGGTLAAMGVHWGECWPADGAAFGPSPEPRHSVTARRSLRRLGDMGIP
jgi:hypothetical protein